MKLLIAFFWSGLLMAGQCASSEQCSHVEILPSKLCPRHVCSNGKVYDCKQTINADGYSTCNMGPEAKHALCKC